MQDWAVIYFFSKITNIYLDIISKYVTMAAFNQVPSTVRDGFFLQENSICPSGTLQLVTLKILGKKDVIMTNGIVERFTD